MKIYLFMEHVSETHLETFSRNYRQIVYQDMDFIYMIV